MGLKDGNQLTAAARLQPTVSRSDSLLTIEPWIVRSWQRCLANGHQPAQPLAFNMVSAPAVQRTADQHAALLQAARPVLAQLTRAIAGMHYFALLTDARGVVIEVQGAVDRNDPRAHAIGRVGIDLSEAAVGTTAIGMALGELQEDRELLLGERGDRVLGPGKLRQRQRRRALRTHAQRQSL